MELLKLTWKVSSGLHGPEKMVELMVNTPSDGTSSVAVAESEEHAAFHAARNASVSSLHEPSSPPDAPNALTSNTSPQSSSSAGGGSGGGGAPAPPASGGSGGESPPSASGGSETWLFFLLSLARWCWCLRCSSRL